MPAYRYSSPQQYNVETAQLKYFFKMAIMNLCLNQQRRPEFDYKSYCQWLHVDIYRTSALPHSLKYCDDEGTIVLPQVRFGRYQVQYFFNTLTEEVQTQIFVFVKPTVCVINADRVIKTTIHQL